MLKRNRVLYTVGIIGTGLHSWKAKECENEKPSEGLSFKRSSRNTQRSSLSVCLCAGTQENATATARGARLHYKVAAGPGTIHNDALHESRM